MPDQDPHGSPVLSYSIPQQTAYDSRSYIELVLPADAWLTPSTPSASLPSHPQPAALQRSARVGASLRPNARPVDSRTRTRTRTRTRRLGRPDRSCWTSWSPAPCPAAP